MDVAYDHIQEESLAQDEAASRANNNSSDNQQPQTLNSELQEAFKAVSASPWGARLGGFFGHVKKQSESLYSDAPKIYAAASSQATAGLKNVVDQARNISFEPPTSDTAVSFSDPNFTLPEPTDPKPSKGKEKEVQTDATTGAEHTARPESLPADIVKEATSLVTRFRSEAPTFLTRIQKAEDAADEALLKFGSNLKNFLREAVTVTAPEGSTTKDGEAAEVLFETNDAEGKRVFHTSRFDAQLHVIHTTPTSFTQDPESGEYTLFSQEFDIDKQTSAIAADLDRYEELRRAMEKLVPEKVEYKPFWTRYYFLRKVIEEEERRRREVLKGATAEPEEELGWGSDDSDNEEQEDSTPTPHAARSSTTTLTEANAKPATASTTSSSETAAIPAAATQTQNPKPEAKTLLKPTPSPRRSEDDLKSTADSDASYDIVSGATSRAPGSPKEAAAVAATVKEEQKKKDEVEAVKEEEESDEEDWE